MTTTNRPIYRVIETFNADGDDIYGVWDNVKDEPASDAFFSEGEAEDVCERLNIEQGREA